MGRLMGSVLKVGEAHRLANLLAHVDTERRIRRHYREGTEEGDEKHSTHGGRGALVE